MRIQEKELYKFLELIYMDFFDIKFDYYRLNFKKDIEKVVVQVNGEGKNAHTRHVTCARYLYEFGYFPHTTEIVKWYVPLGRQFDKLDIITLILHMVFSPPEVCKHFFLMMCDHIKYDKAMEVFVNIYSVVCNFKNEHDDLLERKQSLHPYLLGMGLEREIVRGSKRIDVFHAGIRELVINSALKDQGIECVSHEVFDAIGKFVRKKQKGT